MVHLKKDSSKVSVVLGSIEDVTTSSNSNTCQGTHTQTTRPRIRLRKVVVNRKPGDAKAAKKSMSKHRSESEVHVEDYQILKHGCILDGASGKYYKIDSPSKSNHKSFSREGSLKDVNPLAVVQSFRDDDMYDYFGKYVASLLRNLNDQDAISLQGEIVNLIVDVHANIPPEEYISDSCR